MKRMVYIIPFIILAAAAIFLVCLTAGCKKADPDYPDNIDGGVVKSYTDPNAPKVIESTEITEFECTVSTISNTDSAFSGRVFTFKAQISDSKVKGAYSYRIRGGDSKSFDFEADTDFTEKLYAIISRYSFADHNGYFHSVSGLPDMYGTELNVLFASGEEIYAYDNQSNFLENEAIVELVELFEDASGATEEKSFCGMEFSRSHMNWNSCFNISLLPDTEGHTVAFGFCNGPDGTEYSADEPFVISDKALADLKDLNLDQLPNKKKSLSLGLHADDKTTQKLILSYPDGSEEEKELSDDTLGAIFDILLLEFIENSENIITSKAEE